jgi:ribosomal protein RSM22 (predicted rRNA methylase)
MLAPFLREVEQLAWRVAQEVWDAEYLKRRTLVARIKALSQVYNDPERSGPIGHGHGPSGRDTGPARLLFFTLSDLAKLTYPIQELRLAGTEPLRILDLGAGFGAQTLALVGLLDHAGPGGGRELQIDAVDQDPAALELLARLIADCPAATGSGVHTTLRTAAQRISALDPGSRNQDYDLILAGSLLNELDPDQRLPLARALLSTLSPSGHLVLMEPALRHTTRSLHALRDQLLAEGAARVVAPCTRQGPCPALDNPRDWCYERRPFDPPPLLRQLTSATGLRKSSLKWSYVALSPARLASEGKIEQTQDPDRERIHRVVSMPLKSKGKLELFLCGPLGRLRVVRLKRHRSRANAALDRLDRGRLVRIEPLPEVQAGIIQIGRETQVEAWDPGLEPL